MFTLLNLYLQNLYLPIAISILGHILNQALLKKLFIRLKNLPSLKTNQAEDIEVLCC